MDYLKIDKDERIIDKIEEAFYSVRSHESLPVPIGVALGPVEYLQLCDRARETLRMFEEGTPKQWTILGLPIFLMQEPGIRMLHGPNVAAQLAWELQKQQEAK